VEERIAVLGLGYVGLPLALGFARHYSDVVGFDIDAAKVASLGQEHAESNLRFSSDEEVLKNVTLYVIAVPTPITEAYEPDLSHLIACSDMVGKALDKGNLVVYESTVYPGATEEVCAPILEGASGLKVGSDFKLGYSPERINPGDSQHRLENVVKVISAQDEEALDRLAACYGAVVSAGLHRAPSIKVAEAAKVVENTQRDLNIALMNELALILDRMGVNTKDVLEAAGTKWNFLRFHPGLVGGHCLGVDPYYLTAKAKALGYHPEVILAGRRINDAMGRVVAGKFMKLLGQAGRSLTDSKVGIVGICYKPDVGDARNSRVPDIVRELQQFGVAPLVLDELADTGWIKHEYGIDLVDADALEQLDGLILAVPHTRYIEDGGAALIEKIQPGGVLLDVLGVLDTSLVRPDLKVWSL
jgi:UDP-N-acetyl-D-glucosamine/UDP-N-acetyl-D-galactosamine dehydrogenase